MHNILSHSFLSHLCSESMHIFQMEETSLSLLPHSAYQHAFHDLVQFSCSVMSDSLQPHGLSWLE